MSLQNPALRDFWTTKADTKILKGGRASSKTYDTAGFAIYLASRYTMRILCMRQHQSKIQESVYVTLCARITDFGMTGDFEILRSTIKHKTTGSEFLFYGIERNISEIKGTDNIDIGWIEEAESLSEEQYSVINPTLRKDGAELWIIYNPRLATDFVEQFKHDPDNGVIVKHINYDQNPFLSETILRKIARLKAQDIEAYNHIYLGQALTDDDNVIIKRSWVDASIDAHTKLGLGAMGSKRIGFDVADSGSDLCATIYAHGIVAVSGETWKGREDELMKSSRRVYADAARLSAEVTYDCIGVGAACGAMFKQFNDDRGGLHPNHMVKYKKFNAGGKVVNPDHAYTGTGSTKIKNKDHFSGVKSQAWWHISDRFRNTYNAITNGEEFPYDEMISISPDMPDMSLLIAELTTPRRDFDNAGRVVVERKVDLARRGVPSPNRADAFVMAFLPHAQRLKTMAW